MWGWWSPRCSCSCSCSSSYTTSLLRSPSTWDTSVNVEAMVEEVDRCHKLRVCLAVHIFWQNVPWKLSTYCEVFVLSWEAFVPPILVLQGGSFNLSHLNLAKSRA